MSRMKPELLDQIEALIHQISEDDHEEEEWHEILTGEDWKYQNKVNVTECHVIDYIGKNRLTNAVGIATALNMTKGSISKITTRLLEKGFIESHRMEGNRKGSFSPSLGAEEKFTSFTKSCMNKLATNWMRR